MKVLNINHSRAEAIRLAVKYCCNHDILKESLEKHSTEVQNMLITEWNMDDALAVRYEEGMEEGMWRLLKTHWQKAFPWN